MSTIPELVARAARERAHDVAIADGDTVLTCADLAAASHAFARGLCALGVTHGDAVAIWAPNGWRWIVAALGAQTLGAMVVPINTRYKVDEASHVIERSRARVLVTVEEFLGVRYADSLRGRVPHVITDATWNTFLSSGAPYHARVEPETIGDLMFTSGTTGAPRGVPATHAQTVRAYSDWASIVGLRRGDRYLVVAPFFHSFGYKAGWVAALATGAVILPQPVFDADAVLARIAAERVNVLPGPPTLYFSLLQKKGAADLSSLRLAVTGAANVPVELVRRMRGELGFETVLTGYGLTEATGIGTLCRAGDDAETVATTSGRAMPGLEVAIAPDGEVLIRGYSVMRGYWEDATDCLVDGWLHTGDIGVLDERGNLRITDRKKDMFIVGGFNAYPAEIEGVLLQHPAIAQVAVVGAPDERLGEVGVAFVIARAAFSDEELTAWCRERMANYKVPRRFVACDSLPLNASGKVKKYELRARVR